ncbi:unnamed protein product [Oncorhynchus mykiss]|uniref:Uncharacterized protein n=1 Tax=Oncorhynchus mykiss TaxID=8022 RepID=A0A060VT68_ONCMY|nr:unnamed protein product [Oncorhynchus mykiss]
MEEEWRRVLQTAEETLRQAQVLLQGVVERLVTCQYQKCQAQSCLAEVQHQTAELPRHFPWPGLGDRGQAVETARTLLDKTRNLAPALSVLHTQGKEMFQLTQDPSWTDLFWATMEECIPALLQELTVGVRSPHSY